MKKAIITLFVLLLTLFAVYGALADEKNNKPEIKTVDNYIAVFDFEVRTGDKDISRLLADKVIHVFTESNKYEVIDRGNMNKILGEQKFQMSGCVAQECKVEAGQMLGVGKIVNGSLGIIGKTYYLTLQMIDVKTGKVELSAEDECRCEIDELLGSTRMLAKKLLGEKVEQPVKTELKPVTTTIAIVPPAVPAKETARDGRFIAYDNGTVLDTRTNLMWAAKDNGTDINWQGAKNYCENFTGGGYTDWRMPTIKELAGLYDPSKTYTAECKDLWKTHDVHLTGLIRLTCWSPWSSDTDGFIAKIFFFVEGGSMDAYNWKKKDFRALPVRFFK
jgi:TolB-like protein